MAKRKSVSKSAPPKKGADVGKKAPGKSRDREATQASLLNAARCVFAKRGFDAATTKEIAREAEVNEALIQRYFGGKAGLLDAILTTYGNPCPKSRADAVAATSPEESLVATLKTFFAGRCGEVEKSEELLRVMVSRAILDPKTADTMKVVMFEDSQATIARQLEILRERKLIASDIDLRATAHALAALSFSLGFFGRVVYRYPEETVASAIASITEILARGIGKKAD